MMSEAWKVTDRTVMPAGDNFLDNPFYGYTETHLDLPGDKKATYYGVDVGNCVHAVVLDDDMTTYLVHQKRPNLLTGKDDTNVPETLELPGGFAIPGKSLETSIRKEIVQEIGKAAVDVIKVGALLTSPGLSNERDHIFLAEGLTDKQDEDPVEATEADMRLVPMPFGAAYDMIRSGSIPVAAQTLAAMSLVAARL